MKAPALPKAPKKSAQKPVDGVEIGDHVYVRANSGPMAVRVLAHGADGFTAECDKRKRHQVPWDRYLGHRSRMLHNYEVVDQGADGALLEDGKGRRRYLAGELPTAKTNAKPDANYADSMQGGGDDPLLGGMDRLKKAAMLPSNAVVMFLKAGQVANRPGLALEAKTDRAGHQTHRWVRTMKDQPKGRDRKAPEDPHTTPMKHGETVQFRHCDVGGEGKIVGSGKDGVTLQDGEGRTHQVRHEHLVKPGDKGADKGADTKADGSAGGEPAKPGSADAGSDKVHAAATGNPPSLFTSEETKSLPAQVSQPTKDRAELLAKSAEALDQLKAWLDQGKGICSQLGYETMKGGVGGADMAKPGGMLFIAPLKGEKRAAEKVESDYGGDWSKLLDTVRCSIAVDTYDQVGHALEALRKGGMKLARQPKDRFHKALPVGYRDLMMNVELPNGIVGEVQIHVKPMLAAKSAGHEHYEVERRLQSKKDAGLTGDEETELKGAIEAQERIYHTAWQASVGGAASGGEMRKALGGEGEFSFFDHDGAQFRRRNRGLFRAVDDVLVGGQWKPYQGSDPLAPALFGDEIEDPLGKGGPGGGEQMAKSRILFLKAHNPHQPRDRLGRFAQAYDADAEINRGASAMREVIANKRDVLDAMNAPGVGKVAFLWGKRGGGREFKGGFGVAHILAKHGESVATQVPEVLARGKRSSDTTKRAIFTHGEHAVVLTESGAGPTHHWVLTAFVTR